MGASMEGEVPQLWDSSFPLEKSLKKYNLAHPRTVLKITEKLLRIYRQITKRVIFLLFFGSFSTGRG